MTAKTNPIPDEYPGATPYLSVKGAARAIEYYKNAFGAREVMRIRAAGRPHRSRGVAHRRGADHARRRISRNEFSEPGVARRHARQYSRLCRRRRWICPARYRGRRQASAAGDRPVLRRPRGRFEGPLRPLLVFCYADRRCFARRNEKASRVAAGRLMRKGVKLPNEYGAKGPLETRWRQCRQAAIRLHSAVESRLRQCQWHRALE